MRGLLHVLLGTLCSLVACGDQRAPLIGQTTGDGGASSLRTVYGVVVLAQTALPELTNDPVCAGEPALIVDGATLGAIFGDSPPTDNTSCPGGSVCCLSAADFTYSVHGQALADGPITLAVSTGVDEKELTGQVLLLPQDGTYPPPGTEMEPALNGPFAFPPGSNPLLTTHATFAGTGTSPWTTSAVIFPDPPWSPQICGGYAAAPPLPRTAWTQSWAPSESRFERVLLTMRYEDGDRREAGYVLCAVPAEAGVLTVPETIMSALPPGGRAYPILVGERTVLVPLDSAGAVRVVLQNRIRLSPGDLPLGD